MLLLLSLIRLSYSLLRRRLIQKKMSVCASFVKQIKKLLGREWICAEIFEELPISFFVYPIGYAREETMYHKLAADARFPSTSAQFLFCSLIF